MLIKWGRVFRFINANEALVEEIETMLESQGGGVPDTHEEEEKEDKKKKKISKDSNNEDEIDEEEEEEEEDFDEEDEDVDEEEEGEEDDEEDEEKESPIIAALQKQVADLKEIILTSKKEKDNDKELNKEVIDPFKSKEFNSFVETLDWEEDEVSAFKKFLNIYTEQTHNKTIDKILKVTPKLINKSVSTQTTFLQKKRDFYNEHPAFKNIKSYVSATASDIAKQKGDNASIDEVLKETAEVLYKTLGIKKIKKTSAPGKGKKKKPAFAKTKGARKISGKKKKSKNDQSDQIDEMITSLRL